MEEQTQALAKEILEKVLELGADMAGFAAIRDVVNCSAEQLFPQMKDTARDRFAKEITTGLPHGAVKWEADEQTLLVFAVSHPEDQPELDWWVGEISPPGNKLLMGIARKLKTHLAKTHPHIRVYPKPYHIEKGGVYLKDAAVMAGLGCIGKNNLLVTPKYGPRIRLRAVGLSLALPSSGVLDFDPCNGCDQPCRTVCPHGAFDHILYTPEETGLSHLPARNGSYARGACALEMTKSESTAEVIPHPEEAGKTIPQIRYCRECEFRCKVGQPEASKHNKE